MSGITYSLDFLLVVETVDHQIIGQTPDDKSRFNNGSFFGDIKDLPLIKASLIGKGHFISVDLVDGHAEVDGVKVCPPQDVVSNTRLKLVYRRTVQQRRTYSAAVGIKQVLFGESKDLGPLVKYFIGWEYFFKGKTRHWELGME